MKWQETTDKDKWESFLTKHSQGGFLQSWAFGDLHTSLGNKIWRLGLVKDSEFVGVCLVVKLSSKASSLFYIPGGPVVNNWEDVAELISLLSERGKEEKISFVRFDPRIVDPVKLKALGLKEAPYFTQPECSQILNLEKPLEEIKRNFSESTRYNVGWVERQGVRVEVSQNKDDINIFTKLLNETASRHGFRVYNNPDYYKKQFLAFQKDNQAKLYLAREPQKEGNEVLAAAIVFNYGSTTTYLHASSSSRSPKLRAPYLMQWQIIQDAKNAGFKNYDFWGIAASESPRDPWAGVSAFKKSFGGEKVCYQKPFDLPLSSKYNFDRFLEIIRKPILRLMR